MTKNRRRVIRIRYKYLMRDLIAKQEKLRLNAPKQGQIDFERSITL